MTSSDTNDSLEFVAFLSWYLFLVVCCVVPTCCAYRRRRMMARIEREVEDGDQGFRLVGNWGGRLGMNEEQVRIERTERITEALKATTFVVEEQDITTNTTGNTGDNKSTVHVDEELGAVLDHDMMDHSILRLPSEKLNAERWVPGGCAICLDLYKEGDVVAWSTEASCKHAFHSDCIIPWLAKKEEPECACCRQDFCLVEPVTVSEDSNRILPLRLIHSSLIMGQTLSQRGSDLIITPTPDLVASQVVTEGGIARLPDGQASEAGRTEDILPNENETDVRSTGDILPNENETDVKTPNDILPNENETDVRTPNLDNGQGTINSRVSENVEEDRASSTEDPPVQSAS